VSLFDAFEARYGYRQKNWKPRCENCRRRIFVADFRRDLAKSDEYWFDTLGGPDSREIYYHTYDCESLKRRRTK